MYRYEARTLFKTVTKETGDYRIVVHEENFTNVKTAKKSTDVLRESDVTRSPMSRIRIRQATFFDHVNKMREIWPYWNTRDIRRKVRENAEKDVGWTKKVILYETPSRCTPSVEVTWIVDRPRRLLLQIVPKNGRNGMYTKPYKK